MTQHSTTPLRLTTIRIGEMRTRIIREGMLDLDVRHFVRIAGGTDGRFRRFPSVEHDASYETLEAALASFDAANARSSDGITFEVALVWRDDTLPIGPDEAPCSICGSATPASARAPRAVCAACEHEATDADGRALRFSNVSFSGGFEARHADDGSIHAGHECFIRGIRCRADEARFGGIVVEPV